VRLEVHARDLAFDKAELRARAGAQVTAVFMNDDAGVDHNLSFTVTGLDHGDTCPGPCTATQTFTAPAAGRYQFFCTIHPMVGTFIVDP
jgi:plastocyanin